MVEIIGVGELLIDFVQEKKSITYTPNPGGAPCNFLTMAQEVGNKTGFIGKIGNDAFGAILRNTIEERGIDTRGVVMSDEDNTTLAFVHLNPDGDRSFSFYRKLCADVMLTEYEVDFEYIDQAKLVHFGSLSFTENPSRDTVYKILDHCKSRGKLISYDPNYRANLWRDEAQAIGYMMSGFKYADFIKVSHEELELLSGEKDYGLACEKLMGQETKIICVTLGDEGVYYHTPKYSGIVSGFRTRVVDTTGAGDTFFGAFVGQIIKKKLAFDDMNQLELEEVLRRSNQAAAMCVEAYGGSPSIPTWEQVLGRLESYELSDNDELI